MGQQAVDYDKLASQHGGTVVGDPADFGLRADGTPKGNGFLGVLKRPDGSVSSEISIGVNIDGKDVDIPTLVPTLTDAEKQWLLSNDISDPKKIPPAIIQKAVDFARPRIKAGLSPFAGDHEKPHPEASIGPTPEDAPVTLGDLIDDPHAAVQRMIAITKKGLSDPRNTIPALVGIAAGATGLMPRSFASTRGLAQPTEMPAPPAPKSGGLAQAIRQHITLDDVVEAIPGAKNAKAAYRIGKGLVNAAQQARKPAATVAESAPTPTPAATAPTSVSTAAAPATPPAPKATAPKATAPKTAKAANAPDEAAADLPSLDELHLTPAEITQGVKWHEQGVSPETILHRILQSRQLTARTKTETPDQAAEAVRQRNLTGHWGDEGYVK